MAYELDEAVRRKLNITWSDEDTDARLEDIMATVKPAVARVLGIDPTDTSALAVFEEGGEESGILVNACFYEWNHALDEFWQHYADDIQRVRLRNDAAAYAADAS